MNAVSGSRWRETGGERQKTRGKVRQTETETERESGGQPLLILGNVMLFNMSGLIFTIAQRT